MSARWIALLSVAGAMLGAGLFASAAQAEVVWLCGPEVTDDPCEIPLDTTVQGKGIENPKRVEPDKRPVDCFYVYPTVSNQPGLNATQARDPEIESIAEFQAARFSSECRVFAPIYRQIPLAGLAAFGMSGPGSPAETAFSDVLEAWRDYLANDNGGRGVILIGHSQGTIMLRNLIRTEIEKDPKQQELLAGALLLGGNVTTKAGETTGGDFQSTPICTERGQFGCVVAYSTYSTDPGPAPFFGNTNSDFTAGTFSSPTGAGYEIACTDPGVLSGDDAPVGVTLPSEPFATGPISVGIIATNGGPPPTASTTWVQPPDRFTGACKSINGANVYRYDPVAGSRRPNEFPPDWGTHLLDVNLGYDRLRSIARLQAGGWLGSQLKVGKAKLNRRKGTAKLPVTVPGAGKLELAGKKIRTRRGTAKQPSVLKLKVAVRGKARRALVQRGKVRAKVQVSYKPGVGPKQVVNAKVRLRRRG